jgi:hypothetical protein
LLQENEFEINYLKITNAVLAQSVVGSANQLSHQIFCIVGNFTATISRQIKAVLLQHSLQRKPICLNIKVNKILTILKNNFIMINFIKKK